MAQDSIIANFYRGKNILVTGATGFMGKVLIEKLLSSCPDISNLYIIVRSKKGKTPAQRLDDIINCPVFDRIRDLPNGEDRLQKLHCMSGDVSQTNLNLSNDDLITLQQNVEVIFHMAANVRFDQPLKPAVLLNLGGTKNLLNLACSIKNLKAFVHVSTSYCHCDEVKLEEKLYKAPHDPLKILDLVSWMNDDLLISLTPKLLKNFPNTYAYTKSLTEELVIQYSNRLPIAITRPSIITAAWKEPIPGWIDNLNGPTGLLVGAGKGVIRTMHCDPNLEADIVPVDTAINSLIIVAWKLAMEHPLVLKQKKPKVFHITANKENAISWGEALEIGRKHFYNNPFSVCLWYPGGSIKSNYFVHMLAVFFFHIIPAYIIDALMFVTGNKTFLVRTQKRIQNGLEVLQYYTTRPWYFHNEKITKLWNELNDTDQKIFYIDREQFNYNEYILTYVLGARKYCVHEEPETLPYARKVLRRLYYLDLFKNIVLGCLLLWLFISYAPLILKTVEGPFAYTNSTLRHIVIAN